MDVLQLPNPGVIIHFIKVATMAQGKKSFILYTDLISTVSKLTDPKAGKLFKTILEYVNDKNPQITELLIQVAFEPIKQQLKRDLKDWEDERKNRSDAGKKGMAKRWSKHKKITKDNKNNSVINPITNITDTVTVTVTDTVRENTEPAHDLKNSNLFRKPVIPTKNQVLKAITESGGTKEMAKSFWAKHEATGWYINGSPIVNMSALAGRFVSNWNDNSKKENNIPSGPTLKILNG